MEPSGQELKSKQWLQRLDGKQIQTNSFGKRLGQGQIGYVWDLSRQGNWGKTAESCVVCHSQHWEASGCDALLTSVILSFLPLPGGVRNIHTLMNGSHAGGFIGSLGRGLHFHGVDVIL